MGFDRSKGSSNALNEVDPFEVSKTMTMTKPHSTRHVRRPIIQPVNYPYRRT